ncbi:MAG: lysophospholipid acyltransferase family protein, partial [Phycisphaerales bacterium]
VVFPEGTRSEDGELKEFKRGVSIMIRKAAVPILPMAIEGTFEAWPKGRLLPLPFRRIGCLAGPLIPADEVAELFRDPTAGMLELQRRIAALQQELRSRMGRAVA